MGKVRGLERHVGLDQQDHLLFGTERVRNLTVESYYEAKRIEAGGE